jgi:hypothetical protein
MRVKSAQCLWLEFTDRLGSGSLLDVLCNAQTWLRENWAAFNPRVRGKRGEYNANRYQLDRFVDLDLKDFPLEESGFDVQVEVAALRRLSPVNKLEGVASFVAYLFWSSITVSSGKSCPQCHRQEDLKIMVDASDPAEVYLACDNCPWAETIDGMDATNSDVRMNPPTIEQLDRIRWKLPTGHR